MRNFLKACSIVLIMLMSCQSFAQLGIDKVRERVRNEILDKKVDDHQVKTAMNTLREDGAWPGINYEDVSRTGFEHSKHLDNMVNMSIAYNLDKSKYYHSTELKNAIDKSLNFWLKNDFICENWWWNQIGTTKSLVEVLLLMDDALSEEQVEMLLPILQRSNLDATGARPSGDRIKIAGILAKKLLFLRDKKSFDEVIKVIEGEIKYATGRGMQIDYSFHHRKDRVNNTVSYGLSYADTFAEWAAYVAKTEYAFSEEKINQLIDYYLDGICKHMIFGKYYDPASKNRSISRKGGLKPMGSTIPKKLISTTDYRKGELAEIIDIRDNGIKPSLSFAKFYWQSEHFTFQRPDFFTSVRMFSTRNHNMEYPYNKEGLFNHHKGDGVNYVSLNGTEFNEIWAMYDWQKIPGTTVVQKASLPGEKELQKPGLTDFVGAVTDGLYGAVAFDFKSPHDPMLAKKAWFFFDEEYVCLGTGINSSSNQDVVTTVNQCLLRGDVFVSKNDNQEKLKNGKYSFENANWILHDGIGYIFPKSTKVELENKEACGSWYSINKHTTTPKAEVCKDVFKLWIDHGQKPNNASYQYIVVPATSADKIREKPLSRDIRVLSNTSDIQAVCHDDLDICQVIFYKAGTIQINDQLKVTSKNPGIIMLKMGGSKINQIAVADPSRKLENLQISVSQKLKSDSEQVEIDWNQDSKQSNLKIALPKDVYAGKSVVLSF